MISPHATTQAPHTAPLSIFTFLFSYRTRKRSEVSDRIVSPGHHLGASGSW